MYRYEAITAKTLCLMSRLLTEDQLLHMSGLGSVTEVAVFLREKTAYGEMMREMNLNQVSRRKVEYYIKKTLIADYLKMQRFTHGNERKYIGLMLRRYEIEYMLNAWRYCGSTDKLSVEEPEGLLEMYAIYGQKAKVDLTGLRNADNIKDFLTAVSGTEYYRAFERAKSYAEVEHEIYAAYYKKLISTADLFGGDSIRTVLSAAADLKNIERIYRMRYNFGMTPEETVKRMLPFRHRLTVKDTAELINIGDPKSYLKRCNETYYGKKVDFTALPVSVCGLLYLYRLYKSTALKNRSSFDVVVKYFYIKETEIENLVYIIEGVRYGMHPDEIKANLIGNFGGTEVR